jgi:serine/threonine protein kinase
VDKITLHLGDLRLDLDSSTAAFMTTVYQHLKKHISHKGFNDYFKPLKRLGRGSFAAVYLIESKATGKRLAAKVFSREGQKLGYKGKEALEKEIENLKLLSHPNII